MRKMGTTEDVFYSSRTLYPINRRTLRLKRIGGTSSQRNNHRMPGAVNQRAWLRPPSHRDSDRPESSRCLARALASNESVKHIPFSVNQIFTVEAYVLFGLILEDHIMLVNTRDNLRQGFFSWNRDTLQQGFFSLPNIFHLIKTLWNCQLN